MCEKSGTQVMNRVNHEENHSISLDRLINRVN